VVPWATAIKKIIQNHAAKMRRRSREVSLPRVLRIKHVYVYRNLISLVSHYRKGYSPWASNRVVPWATAIKKIIQNHAAKMRRRSREVSAPARLSV
jgi:hypothetical protein